MMSLLIYDAKVAVALAAFQWFNPAIWMLRADLQEIHEYEADDAVLRAGADIREYQYLLIRKAVSKSGYSVANSFNHSILKNRITMMSKSKSPLSRGLRVLYVIPLVCLGLGLQARTVYVPDDKDNKNIFAGTEQDYEVNTDSLVFTIIAAPDTKMEEIDEIRNGLRRRGIQKIYYRLEGSESVIGDDAELLRKGKDFLRSRGADAQFLLRCDLGTSYGAYLHLQSLLRQVYDEVRAETGRDYPVKIAEAAMKDSAGRN